MSNYCEFFLLLADLGFWRGVAGLMYHPPLRRSLVNAFAYWQAQDIGNATHTYFDDVAQAFEHIQTIAGPSNTPELWNGETGWPTDGEDRLTRILHFRV